MKYAYRLRLSDADGNFRYSETKQVKIEDAVFNVSEISPNPIYSNNAEYSITSSSEQEIFISVYDLSGKEMFDFGSTRIGSGQFWFNLPVSKLTAGTYNLVIRSATETVVKSFSVVK
jgi:hypothetical protein